MAIQLTEHQENALEKVLDWYNKTDDVIATLSGYAGTGKSTVLDTCIDRLKLDKRMHVVFLTLTGKASLVLQSKGLKAKTLHSFMYSVETYYNEKTRTMEFDTFLKHPDTISDLIKLVVIDEVSMVSDDLFEDLLTLVKAKGLKVLCLGDQAQIPPINQGVYSKHLLDNALFQLTETHRFAEGSGIHQVATLFRTGGRLQHGQYGDNCLVIPKERYKKILRQYGEDVEQILVTTNKRRVEINQLVREIQGFNPDVYTPQVGEKVMFTRNNWGCSNLWEFDEAPKPDGVLEINVINGLIGKLHSISWKGRDKAMGVFRAELHAEGYDPVYYKYPELIVDSQNFAADYSNGKFKCSYDERDRVTYAEANSPYKLNNMDLAYALTIHKSQGSEFESVIYFHEPWGDTLTKRQLAYTAATRAKKFLIVLM